MCIRDRGYSYSGAYHAVRQLPASDHDLVAAAQRAQRRRIRRCGHFSAGACLLYTSTLYKPRAVEQAVRRAMYGAAGYARGGYAAAGRAGELVYALSLIHISRVKFTAE